MFERMIRFFINNARMNYTLFFLIFALGIYSYIKTPKEIFPSFQLEMISINGYYSGASVDILNKMIVNDIEDSLKNLQGIQSLTTVISSSKFNIFMELKEGVDRYNKSNQIKDIISNLASQLPSDMDEPSVNVLEIQRDLIELSIMSKTLKLNELKQIAKNAKSKILGLKDIADVVMYGDSDQYYEILVNESKLLAFGIKKNSFYSALSKLSYIYPLGKLEGKKHFYLSTYNGPKSEVDLKNTLLNIDGISIYLKDITKVRKRYKDTSTLFSINGNNALNLKIKMSNTGNSIELTKDLQKLVSKLQEKRSDIEYILRDDNSLKIKDRLNIVISNIILGILLITLLVIFLINTRMALIIAIGIPTSFVMGAIYFYFFGYTINMISLVGVMIAIGIVVDDAIVVSENIQQHIEKGMDAKEAAIKGACEMAKPVTIASLTTLFSFIPMLLLSGTMGEIMKLIPIAFSALIIASLIESFLFLPIHAAHVLKKEAKVLSWEKVNKLYSELIHFFMRWKKSFLIIFIIIVPACIGFLLVNSNFQMFPRFDGTKINITIKANINTSLQDSYKIVQEIESELLEKRKEFYIKDISSVAGYRSDKGGNSQRASYVMYMTIELERIKAKSFVDKYITPYLSFYYNDEGRIREKKSFEIAKDVKKWLKEKDYTKKYNLEDIGVKQRGIGHVKADVKIGFSSKDYYKSIKHIDKIKEYILTLDGIKNTSSSASFGINEIKLKINTYAKSLGLSEAYVASKLSHSYLSRTKTKIFDNEGMIDLKVKSQKEEDLEELKNTQILINKNQYVRLKDLVDFIKIKSFESLNKDNGVVNFFLYANVNADVITAGALIKKIQPLLDKAKDDGIKLVFKGEEEKKEELKSDMTLAFTLSLVLILLSMLYLFNSFKDTFILMSVIPFSLLGVLLGHNLIGLNLTLPTIIGALGLAGVVINDGIIMMTFLRKAKNIEDIFYYSAKRFRPIVLTTITTIIGLSTLMFFPSGQAAIFQPMAIALGFGLAWGTVLNLVYLPVLYTFVNKLK